MLRGIEDYQNLITNAFKDLFLQHMLVTILFDDKFEGRYILGIKNILSISHKIRIVNT